MVAAAGYEPDEPEMANIRTRSGRAVKAPERFNDVSR